MLLLRWRCCGHVGNCDVCCEYVAFVVLGAFDRLEVRGVVGEFRTLHSVGESIKHCSIRAFLSVA